MNLQIIFSFFFLLSFFVQVQAQEASTNRALNAIEKMSLDSNTVEELSYQLFRFQTAVEEKDQESTDAIRAVILEQMELYLKTRSNQPGQDPKSSGLTSDLSKMMDAFRKASIDVNRLTPTQTELLVSPVKQFVERLQTEKTNNSGE